MTFSFSKRTGEESKESPIFFKICIEKSQRENPEKSKTVPITKSTASSPGIPFFSLQNREQKPAAINLFPANWWVRSNEKSTQSPENSPLPDQGQHNEKKRKWNDLEWNKPGYVDS